MYRETTKCSLFAKCGNYVAAESGDSYCRACRAAKTREWRVANPAAARAISRRATLKYRRGRAYRQWLAQVKTGLAESRRAQLSQDIRCWRQEVERRLRNGAQSEGVGKRD